MYKRDFVFVWTMKQIITVTPSKLHVRNDWNSFQLRPGTVVKLSNYVKLRKRKLLMACTAAGNSVMVPCLPYLHCTASYHEEVVRCLPARKPKCLGYSGFSVEQIQALSFFNISKVSKFWSSIFYYRDSNQQWELKYLNN